MLYYVTNSDTFSIQFTKQYPLYILTIRVTYRGGEWAYDSPEVTSEGLIFFQREHTPDLPRSSVLRIN